jgi:CrcB protein
MRFAIVFFAGGAGCVARYGIAQLVGMRSFPYATLIVNLVGSFLIAFVLGVAERVSSFPPNLRIALTAGFMGGFTTYSSFNYETTALAAEGASGRALLNVLATLVGCLLAGLLGLWLARRIT